MKNLHLCFGLLFSFLLGSNLFATETYRLAYDHKSQQINMVDANGEAMRFWFDLNSGSLMNHWRSAEGQTAKFRGEIFPSDGDKNQLVLNTESKAIISLLFVPEHLNCRKGEFELLDRCSPKHCGFREGAYLLSAQCDND